MTNKRNAEHQIANRVRRLERATLALDAKQRLRDHEQREANEKEKDQEEATSDEEETDTEGDSDLRYCISASKRSPRDIFSIIRSNRGDCAYHVCLSN